MRQKVDRLKKSPIIAVIRNIPQNRVLPTIEALLEGGISNIEIAYGNLNPPSLIKEAKKQFKNEVLLGAGTVMTINQSKEAIEAGAEFVFSPVFNEDVIRETIRNNVLSIPGCFSPTEIYNAYKAGASVVKVFPANTLKPDFIKHIKAPMPFLDFIPTGGVNKSNLIQYLEAGAIAVGMGSSLLDKHLIEEGKFSKLTKSVKEHLSIIQTMEDS